MAEVKSTYSAETLALLETLGARPIAYHVAFARVWGVKAAILLGQLIYWHGKQANAEGWILKTAGEMEEETALTEREQETARASLLKAGAIDYSRRGLPAMPHYKLIYPRIAESVLAYQESTKARRLIGQNVLTSEGVCSGDLIGQNVLTNSEITTETTSENTAESKEKEESGASAPAPAPSAPASEPPSSGSVSLQAPDSTETGSSKRATKRGGKKSPANFTEHADKRVQLYLTYILPEITETNAGYILSRVSEDYPDEWEAAIAEMATGKGRMRSYNPTDFSLLFDLYDSRVRATKAAALMAKHAKTPTSAAAARPAPVSPIAARLNARGFATRP